MTVWAARPTTALMVTHNLREALLLADRIIVLSPGPAQVLGIFDVPLARHLRDAPALDNLVLAFHKRFPDSV
jgi:NitT/TauT family transport system ATP-binding protein